MQEVRLSKRIIACSNMRGILKPKGNGFVQVVLLFLIALIYQGQNYLELSKYGGGDISEGSLVFSLTKSGKAEWQTATFSIHKS